MVLQFVTNLTFFRNIQFLITYSNICHQCMYKSLRYFFFSHNKFIFILYSVLFLHINPLNTGVLLYSLNRYIQLVLADYLQLWKFTQFDICDMEERWMKNRATKGQQIEKQPVVSHSQKETGQTDH